MKATILLAALGALSLAGCGERPTGSAPQGSEVGAAMPDTSQPRDANAQMTAPDAGATGVVPADGATPAAAPEPAPGEPATK